MSLNEIVMGKRNSSFLLITDTYEADGYSLLIAITQSLIDRKCAVDTICLENPVSHIKDSLLVTVDKSVTYHDLFTDQKGWLGEKDTNGYQCELEKVFSSLKAGHVLVIDSLASMINNSNSAAVYALIQRIVISCKTTGSRVVGLLHRDMVDEFEVADICHLAGIVLRVHPPKPNSHGRPLCWVKMKILKGNHRRRVEHYSVDACNRVWSEPYTESIKNIPTDPVDPMADVTTFKLSLEEKEKEARSQLVLPYLRSDSAKESSGSGVIHYQPDEMDDWDEEDPDNDLNI